MDKVTYVQRQQVHRQQDICLTIFLKIIIAEESQNQDFQNNLNHSNGCSETSILTLLRVDFLLFSLQHLRSIYEKVFNPQSKIFKIVKIIAMIAVKL